METPPSSIFGFPPASRTHDFGSADKPGVAVTASIPRDGGDSQPGSSVSLVDVGQALQNGTEKWGCQFADKSTAGTGGAPMKFGNGQKNFDLGTLSRVGEIGHHGLEQDRAMYDDGEVFLNSDGRGREGLGGLSPVYKEGLSQTSGGGARRRRPALDNRGEHDSDSDYDRSQKNVFTSTPEYRDDLLIMQMDVNEIQQCYYKELSQMPDDAEGYLSSDGDNDRFLSMPRLSNEKERLQRTKNVLRAN